MTDGQLSLDFSPNAEPAPVEPTEWDTEAIAAAGMARNLRAEAEAEGVEDYRRPDTGDRIPTSQAEMDGIRFEAGNQRYDREADADPKRMPLFKAGDYDDSEQAARNRTAARVIRAGILKPLDDRDKAAEAARQHDLAKRFDNPLEPGSDSPEDQARWAEAEAIRLVKEANQLKRDKQAS